MYFHNLIKRINFHWLPAAAKNRVDKRLNSFSFTISRAQRKRKTWLYYKVVAYFSYGENFAETKSHRPVQIFSPRNHSFIHAEGIANFIFLNFNLKSVHLLYSANTDIRCYPLSCTILSFYISFRDFKQLILKITVF